MELADQAWKDVEAYLERRKDVILPFGAVEEHGPHLPISTDTDIAGAVARRLGEDLGVMVAPPVWYGVSNSTRGYPGTVMVGFDALKDYVEGLIRGFEESGFETVYMISGHLSGSQKAAIKEGAKLVEGIRCYLLDFSDIDISDIVETRPLHACEAETSLMLYLCPEKVRMEEAVDEEPAFSRYLVTGGLEKTESGVFGHPTKATAEKGRLIFERIVEEFRGVIEGEATN
jgi:creatinine amidohydrolase